MAATEFTPVASAAGGALIGVAAVLLMLLSGRIAGVSGIVGRLLPPYRDGGVLEALAFVLALVAAPLVYTWASQEPVAQTVSSNIWLMVAAGLLVGFGAGLSGGCTERARGLRAVAPVAALAGGNAHVHGDGLCDRVRRTPRPRELTP